MSGDDRNDGKELNRLTLTCPPITADRSSCSLSEIGHALDVSQRLAIGVIWVATVLITVVTAFATRSGFADVNPAGGAFIVVGCAVVAALSIGLIRSPLVLGVTAIVAAVLACAVAWGVLHDDSSTAAIGVIVPPMLTAFVAFVGVLVTRTRRDMSARP
jgi:hypothetical protein